MLYPSTYFNRRIGPPSSVDSSCLMDFIKCERRRRNWTDNHGFFVLSAVNYLTGPPGFNRRDPGHAVERDRFQCSEIWVRDKPQDGGHVTNQTVQVSGDGTDHGSECVPTLLW